MQDQFQGNLRGTFKKLFQIGKTNPVDIGTDAKNIPGYQKSGDIFKGFDLGNLKEAVIIKEQLDTIEGILAGIALGFSNQPVDGDTISIKNTSLGTETYTFRNAPAGGNDVLIGGDIPSTLNFFIDVVNNNSAHWNSKLYPEDGFIFIYDKTTTLAGTPTTSRVYANWATQSDILGLSWYSQYEYTLDFSKLGGPIAISAIDPVTTNFGINRDDNSLIPGEMHFALEAQTLYNWFADGPKWMEVGEDHLTNEKETLLDAVQLDNTQGILAATCLRMYPSNANNNDSITITDGTTTETYIFKAVPVGGFDVLIAGDSTATIAALVNSINANSVNWSAKFIYGRNVAMIYEKLTGAGESKSRMYANWPGHTNDLGAIPFNNLRSYRNKPKYDFAFNLFVPLYAYDTGLGTFGIRRQKASLEEGEIHFSLFDNEKYSWDASYGGQEKWVDLDEKVGRFSELVMTQLQLTNQGLHAGLWTNILNNANNNDTLILTDGTTIETFIFKAAAALAFEIQIGGNAAATLTNMIAQINTDSVVWSALAVAFNGAAIYEKNVAAGKSTSRLYGIWPGHQNDFRFIEMAAYKEDNINGTIQNLFTFDPVRRMFGVRRDTGTLNISRMGESHTAIQDGRIWIWTPFNWLAT